MGSVLQTKVGSLMSITFFNTKIKVSKSVETSVQLNDERIVFVITRFSRDKFVTRIEKPSVKGYTAIGVNSLDRYLGIATSFFEANKNHFAGVQLAQGY